MKVEIILGEIAVPIYAPAWSINLIKICVLIE